MAHRATQNEQDRWWHRRYARAGRRGLLDTTVVAAFDTPGGLKLVAGAGKDGVLHVVDRATGALRFKVPVTTQKNRNAPSRDTVLASASSPAAATSSIRRALMPPLILLMLIDRLSKLV